MTTLKVALECSLELDLVITLTDMKLDIMRDGAGVCEEDGEVCGVESHHNLQLQITADHNYAGYNSLIKQRLF